MREMESKELWEKKKKKKEYKYMTTSVENQLNLNKRLFRF